MVATMLHDRLAQLEAEFAHGRRLLDETAARGRELREQLLRIDGAIRVLRELTSDAATAGELNATATPLRPSAAANG